MTTLSDQLGGVGGAGNTIPAPGGPRPPRLLNCGATDPAYGVSRAYAIVGNLAVLPIDGFLSLWWSMPRLIEACDMIAADTGVAAVCFDVHCGGGTALGMDDLEQAVRRLKAVKPLHAIVHDLAASSAYWAIALADEIAITPTGIAGSIGTVLAHMDYSERMKEDKVRPVVIAEGGHKAIGIYGAPITPENEAMLREWTSAHVADFYETVSEGRGVPTAAVKGFEAAIFYGGKAVEVGLADRVVSYRPYIDELVARYAHSGAARPARTLGAAPAFSPPPTSSDPTDHRADPATPTKSAPSMPAPGGAALTPTPAENPFMTLDELRTKHPDLYRQAQETAGPKAEAPATAKDLAAVIPDSAFCFECLKDSLPMSAAVQRWSAKLAADNTALKGELEKAKTAKPGEVAPGFVAKDATGAAPGADNPITTFPMLLNRIAKDRGVPMDRALLIASEEHAQEYKAYEDARTAARG